jgi:hypothetical protein
MARLDQSGQEAPAWRLEEKTRCVEAMEYTVATIHMQGFARMFRPRNFSLYESEHGAVKARGKEIIDKDSAFSARGSPEGSTFAALSLLRTPPSSMSNIGPHGSTSRYRPIVRGISNA